MKMFSKNYSLKDIENILRTKQNVIRTKQNAHKKKLFWNKYFRTNKNVSEQISSKYKLNLV